jgi:hypothetical protein
MSKSSFESAARGIAGGLAFGAVSMVAIGGTVILLRRVFGPREEPEHKRLEWAHRVLAEDEKKQEWKR